MKRGIEDSIECSENMNLTPNHQQLYYQQINNNNNNNNNNNSSTSPLSSSSNSSSCVVSGSTASYSSSSPYSPLSTQQVFISAPGGGNSMILSLGSNHQQQSLNGIVGGGNTSQQQTVPATNPESSSFSTRPEAKKVKIQKSQPSPVVHIRNIPQQISEIEIIQFGLIFGNISNVLNLRSKCQAFLQFEKCEEAQSMINYFANNPITVIGRQIFVQYSNYKQLITDPNNTNNQIVKAALDMAKELHKAAQSGGQNTVLRAMLQNMIYAVNLDTINQIFSRYGPVLKIITFTKNDKFQALIQMKDAASAQAAKTSLHGQNIYSGCCTLHIDYSKLNTLNVKYNNEKSRDYTNPLLPAGDCPDPLLNSMFSPLQLQMAYGSPHFTSALQPTYHHLSQGVNPFLTFQPNLGHHQTLITPTGVLRSTNTNSTPSQLNATQHNQVNSVAAAAAANAAALAAAYGVNLNSTNVSSNSLNTLSNGNNNVSSSSGNSHATNTSGQLIIPIMQNLNDENGYFMMYTTN